MQSSVVHGDGDEPDLNVLAALVEGRLSGPEHASALEHLGSCARCRTVVGELARARAIGAPAAVWRWRTLPLAASLAIAVAGGSIYWLTRDTGAPRRSEVPPSSSQPVVTPQPQPPATGSGAGVTSPATTRPEPVPRVAPPDRTRASGTRTLGGKTFRLVAGERVDVDYRIADAAGVVDIRSRADFHAREQLQPFSALGRRFTVAVNGTVYRVDLPPSDR